MFADEYLYSLAILLSQNINNEIHDSIKAVIILFILYTASDKACKFLQRVYAKEESTGQPKILFLKILLDYINVLKKTISLIYISLLLRQTSSLTVNSSSDPIITQIIFPLTITFIFTSFKSYVFYLYDDEL